MTNANLRANALFGCRVKHRHCGFKRTLLIAGLSLTTYVVGEYCKVREKYLLRLDKISSTAHQHFAGKSILQRGRKIQQATILNKHPLNSCDFLNKL